MNTVPFRYNWWKHNCPLEGGKEVWKDLYYKTCECGARNKNIHIRKGSHPM